jgi:hypothetical protein
LKGYNDGIKFIEGGKGLKIELSVMITMRRGKMRRWAGVLREKMMCFFYVFHKFKVSFLFSFP